MTDIRIVNDTTGETEIDFGGQTYTLCYDLSAVIALEKMRNDRPAIELVIADQLGATDCLRLLVTGSAGARRRLRGGGGTINQDVAQAMLEDIGPLRLSRPLREALSHANCLHLYDEPSAKADDEAAADPLVGLSD